MAVSKKKTEEDQAKADKASSRSFTVLKPFLVNGKRVKEGEVINDLPAGSVGELIQHKKIEPVGEKKTTRG